MIQNRIFFELNIESYQYHRFVYENISCYYSVSITCVMNSSFLSSAKKCLVNQTSCYVAKQQCVLFGHLKSQWWFQKFWLNISRSIADKSM